MKENREKYCFKAKEKKKWMKKEGKIIIRWKHKSSKNKMKILIKLK